MRTLDELESFDNQLRSDRAKVCGRRRPTLPRCNLVRATMEQFVFRALLQVFF